MTTTDTQDTALSTVASPDLPLFEPFAADGFADERAAITTRGELLERLATLPAELESAEAAYLHASYLLEEAKNTLAARRHALVLNGDTITGSIVKKDGDKLTIKSEFLGEVTMPWKAVLADHTAEPEPGDG